MGAQPDCRRTGHDHLVVTIDSSLGIVALNPVIRSLEGLAVGVGEITLGWRFGVPEVGAFYWTALGPEIINSGREEQGLVSV